MQWDWHVLDIGLGGSVMHRNIVGREVKYAMEEGVLFLRLQSNPRRGGRPR
jgi:hypothetical protein